MDLQVMLIINNIHAPREKSHFIDCQIHSK